MNDIILDQGLFADFCRHLSAGITALELVYETHATKSPGYSGATDDPILLGVHDQAVLEKLTTFQYPALIQECARNLRLLKSCWDVFLSEIEQDVFMLFPEAFAQLAPQITVEKSGRGLVVHVPKLLSDAILPVLGRVHHETLQTLDQFQKVLTAVEGDTTRLFLNAKAPTPESQYIQLWVATKLNIPVSRESGVIAVL
ncbi:MAG TPA: hypothetical protein VGM98_05170 [Schlesneria sp.]